jgi:uncharacterized protein
MAAGDKPVCYDFFDFHVPENSMSAADATAFQRGIEQFNRGEYFQAHETWEAIWLAAFGPDRLFLQGIIQLAAAFHHRQNGNMPGTLSLLRRGLEKLAAFPGTYRNIRLGRLREQASLCAEILARGADAPSQAWPKIRIETGAGKAR